MRLELDYEGGMVNFPVDRARSFIEGIIIADEPDAVRWDIQIECEEALIPTRPEDKAEDPGYTGFPENCRLELSGLHFSLTHWRQLEGKASEMSFTEEEVHPILPDNPGNFFFDSCHHSPNNNRVRFGKREGVWFLVEWECVAYAYPDDQGLPIAVKTRLPLQQFQVWFHEPAEVDLEVAKQFVLRFARAEDIGEPERRTPQWVVVPVCPDAV